MIDDMVRPRLAAYYCDEGFERVLDNHLPFYELEPQVCWSKGELYMDVFGCVWRKMSFPHLERSPLLAPSLSGYTFPDLKDKSYFAGIEDFFATYNQHFSMCGFGHGFFYRWSCGHGKFPH
jgi:hypothetical protein